MIAQGPPGRVGTALATCPGRLLALGDLLGEHEGRNLSCLDGEEQERRSTEQLLLDAEAQSALKRGVDKVADTSGSPSGPRGRDVIWTRRVGGPTITNDGVTIAKEIELEDPFEKYGHPTGQRGSQQDDDIAGDSTTTATVLASAMITEGLRHPPHSTNPVQVKGKRSRRLLMPWSPRSRSTQCISEREKIAQVASISAADPAIGETVADAMEKVGKDGVHRRRGSKGHRDRAGTGRGHAVGQGLRQRLHHNQRPGDGGASSKSPYILITDRKILRPSPTCCRSWRRSTRDDEPLLSIAEDVDGEALATLIVDQIRGIFTAVAVKAPRFGDRRKAMLQDVSVLTGGTVISEKVGLRAGLRTPGGWISWAGPGGSR